MKRSRKHVDELILISIAFLVILVIVSCAA